MLSNALTILYTYIEYTIAYSTHWLLMLLMVALDMLHQVLGFQAASLWQPL